MRRLSVDSLLKVLSAGMVAAVFATYIVPQFAALFVSHHYAYVNAWDEETYLSWQGVLGSIGEPGGYSVLAINWILHQVGLSPGLQNLLFDICIPFLTVYLLVCGLARVGVKGVRGWAYATIICFSSVLFNYANPLVGAVLGPYDSTAVLMAGHEYYPSILRTPNPQVSYLLITSAILCWLRTGRAWILALPVPLLYFFVAVPYLIAVVALWLNVLIRNRVRLSDAVSATLFVLLAYVAAGMAMTLLAHLLGYYRPDHPFRQSAFLFHESNRVQLPLALCVLGFVYTMIFIVRPELRQSKQALMFWLMSLVAVATVNLQVFSGFMLSQKNYYDYGLSMLFGAQLVLILDTLGGLRTRLIAVSVAALAVVLLALPNQRANLRAAVVIGAALDRLPEEVYSDPLHAIIPQVDVSSFVPYAYARELAPPFSYQYYFSFIEKQCRLNVQLMDDAYRFAERHGSGSIVDTLNQTRANIANARVVAGGVAYSDKAYCLPDSYQSGRFVIAPAM